MKLAKKQRMARLTREGRCIYCNRKKDRVYPEAGGKFLVSPYKRQCISCALRQRVRKQRKFNSIPWQEGKAGRPPEVKVKYKAGEKI